MPRSTESILLIGDARQEFRSALADVLPDAEVTSVATVFDGIAELAANENRPGGGFTTILAAAEPIERRPEAAVRTLRDLAGDGRLVLFGHPTLELLSRKMLKCGCDDYLVTPANRLELQQVFAAANPHKQPPPPSPIATPPAVAAAVAGGTPSSPAVSVAEQEQAWTDAMVTPEGDVDLSGVGNVLLDALLNHPHDPLRWTLRLLSSRLAPALEIVHSPPGVAAPQAEGDREVLSHPVTTPDGPGGTLYALFTYDADESFVRDLLQRLSPLAGKAAALQARHAALQKMAITDELTGVYNARYFRHFLQRILEKARQMHFPVTLLLFDIDDFKTYNDQFGHQVGDEILKQTAAMMKRCTREHDLVARIGGDEFAVVFWDKEGPRQPREPRQGNISRPPQSPVQIFERFKRMIRSDEFTAIGPHGQGKLGISAGLAVYPYDANEINALIAAADKALMQGAKKQGGKNCLSLVGGNGNGGHGVSH